MDDLADIQRLMRVSEHGTRDEKMEARSQLGELYFEREQWDAAAECFERSIIESGRSPELLGALAMVRIEQGRVAEAGRLMHEACTLAEKEGRRAEPAPGGAWHWLVAQGTRPFRLAASMVAAIMGHREERQARREPPEY